MSNISLKMELVRVIRHTQIDDWGCEILTIDGYRNVIPNNSAFIEAYFWGYPGKTRSKVKRFRDLDAVFAYLNKLLYGGWISDTEYVSAWQKCLDLQRFADLFISKR